MRMFLFGVCLLAAVQGSLGQSSSSTSSTTARTTTTRGTTRAPRPTAPVAPNIIFGTEAQVGEIPHQAYIEWPQAACGASLIEPNWILTAAHCLVDAPEIEVRMGDVDRDNMPFIVRSTDIFVHEGYDPNLLFNDVGLVKLPRDAVGTHISAIPMAASGDFVNVDARASGFGLTEQNQTSPLLLKVDLRTISNDECRPQFAQGYVTENTICVTWKNRENENVCSGDSGGPLSTVIDGQHVLIGVASFVSADGCQAGDPAGFSRVSAFIDWIQTTMANNP